MRPIHISTSPNLEQADVALAANILLDGAKGGEVEKVEEWLENYFGAGIRVTSFNSGRSALWAILKALGVGKGDEVAILGFTCVVVPNSALWLGAKPLFIDIDKRTLNMSKKDLEKKLSSKVKAVIFQDSFGSGVGIEEITEICKRKRIPLIEDAALSLGGTYNGQKLGSFGEAAIVSFGRDKVVSSVFGGAVITKNKKLAKKIKKIQTDLPGSSKSWVRQQLMHPLITWLALQLYDWKIGKGILWVAQKSNLLSKAIYAEEKFGGRPKVFPAKYSDELAGLALHQLEKLERFNSRRREVAKRYFSELKIEGLPHRDEGSTYLRFALRVGNPAKLIAKSRNEGWVWERWYDRPVMPATNQQKIGYIFGSCSEAEQATTQIINLPTYPTLTDSQVTQIIEKMNLWCK